MKKRKQTQKQAEKAGLITISGLSDECGCDRRTIKHYAVDAGLEPVLRKKGAAYYDRSELITAISEVINRKRSTGGGGQIQLPASNDALEYLKDAWRRAWDGHDPLWRFNNDPSGYKNQPVHTEAIREAIGDISAALTKLDHAIGFYHEDDHDGKVTIYQLAQRGARVHRSYRDRLLAWAENYNQPLDVVFWGYPDGIVLFDDNDNEIPAPPDEHIVRKARG